MKDSKLKNDLMYFENKYKMFDKNFIVNKQISYLLNLRYIVEEQFDKGMSILPSRTLEEKHLSDIQEIDKELKELYKIYKQPRYI